MDGRCVIGIDSGGSHTRALCVGLDGRVLGGATTGGGSPTHNADARDHVRGAIGAALASAGMSPVDVLSLAAGMAGFEDETDREWAQDFVGVEGLDCPLSLVNDAVVAQVGAFAGDPGIIVVAGTGSMILGISEAGEHITNDHYNHYAGGARHLSFHAMARLLVEEHNEADAPFVQRIFDYWNVSDRQALRQRVLALRAVDRNEVKRFYGGIAPLVTGYAEQSPLAAESCCWLVGVTGVGIRLLAGHFVAETVHVALEGGLATSPAFAARITTELVESTAGRIQIAPALLDPAAGAVLIALQQAGIDSDNTIIERLRTSNRPTSLRQ